MDNNFKDELEFAKLLALEAGETMRKYFLNANIGVQEKSDKTLVTLADTEINSFIVEKISAKYPEHSVWGEEQNHSVVNSKFTWVCDPLDGTMPYAKGIPISTFSLALVDNNGESVVGVVYDPFLNRLYDAVRGSGAYLNGTKLHVSDKDCLDTAYIDQELWLNEEEQITFDDPKDTFNKKGVKITTLCSAIIAGCFVSEGTFDAMIFGQGKPEDIAALSVIVEEAGGIVTDLFGNKQRYDQNILGAIVSNGKIHEDIVEIIKTINYKSKYFV